MSLQLAMPAERAEFNNYQVWKVRLVEILKGGIPTLAEEEPGGV